jgi:FkbM family methyltransferase
VRIFYNGSLELRLNFRDIFSKVLNYVYSVPFLRDLPIRFIDVNGLKYYARFQDLWRFIKPFEPLTHEFLIKNAKESDVFLDIGAHVGIYSIRLAPKVSKVIALEPEPKNYSFLYKNILVNNLSNKVIPLPIAASDKDGYADLCIKASSGAHTLEDSLNCKRKTKIITLTIDTLLRILKIEKVNMIKIDVEGHEARVINGMHRLLSYNPPRVLVIEIRKRNLYLLKMLAELGYNIVKLDCWDSGCNYGFYLME